MLMEADLDMELEMEARGSGNDGHRSHGDGNVHGQAEPGRSPRRPGKARVLTEADFSNLTQKLLYPKITPQNFVFWRLFVTLST